MKRALLALAILAATAVPAAATPPPFSEFQVSGYIQTLTNFNEILPNGQSSRGCLLGINVGDRITMVLVRHAENLPCSRLYRLNRRVLAMGRIYIYLEVDSLTYLGN